MFKKIVSAIIIKPKTHAKTRKLLAPNDWTPTKVESTFKYPIEDKTPAAIYFDVKPANINNALIIAAIPEVIRTDVTNFFY